MWRNANPHVCLVCSHPDGIELIGFDLCRSSRATRTWQSSTSSSTSGCTLVRHSHSLESCLCSDASTLQTTATRRRSSPSRRLARSAPRRPVRAPPAPTCAFRPRLVRARCPSTRESRPSSRVQAPHPHRRAGRPRGSCSSRHQRLRHGRLKAASGRRTCRCIPRSSSRRARDCCTSLTRRRICPSQADCQLPLRPRWRVSQVRSA